MGNFVTLYLQVLLCSVGPILALGLVAWFARALFIQLIGTHSGRPILLAAFVLSTPLREAAHAAMAVLFWHRIEDARFLNVHDTQGELGYVEHSYNPRNPVALLGNFFYALGPVILGIAAVLAIFMLCFGGVMENFFLELSALGDKGSFADYARATGRLVGAMFRPGEVSIFAKIAGALLLLFLCMGVYASLWEVLDAFSGVLIYAAVTFAFSAMLLLLDNRVQRVILQGLRGFATGVVALFLPLLLCMIALLAFGVVFFLVRKLGAVPETGTAVEPYRADRNETRALASKEDK